MIAFDILIEKELEERISTRSLRKRFMMDKPVIQDSKKCCEQVQKDTRLFNTQQVSPVISFHNGRYQYSQGTSVNVKLDVKDRSAGKFFKYVAMCFGVKHAPLIFHKVVLPLTRIKQELK
ncbi:MAG: hypothetical protein EZS28_015438 [Streblomastix strix]|uniref:Uncharacterized protein n=1 Tax=Streblomastix strix TaxID=222440 RepID=A0A5J4W305_9EUKA|nr:MAG: hypothetical protein EZS28_015438 [Streblomastix strix]